MKNNLTKILLLIIWLLVIALWFCIYSHQTPANFPWWENWMMWRFWSWTRMWPRWDRMWTWMINHFSEADKAIIDELKKARDSWDKTKERELMDKLRNSRDNITK